MIELQQEQAIFVGFRLETGLKRQVDAISGPDQRYVSPDDSTFLRVCRLGDKYYVGKLIEERLSTERIDDIKRNVFSIMQRLFPEERLPRQLEILAAGGEFRDATPSVEEERSGTGEDSHGIW